MYKFGSHLKVDFKIDLIYTSVWRRGIDIKDERSDGKLRLLENTLTAKYLKYHGQRND